MVLARLRRATFRALMGELDQLANVKRVTVGNSFGLGKRSLANAHQRLARSKVPIRNWA